MQARVSFVVVSVVAASLLVGCKNEKETPASGAPEPPKSADPVKALDPELAEAVAAASANAKAAERPAAGTQEGGPPPNGIFPPGAADREAKVGAPPKITLGSEGAPPRQALSFVPKPGTRVAGTAVVELQQDPRQGGLPVELGVVFETQQPKGGGAGGAEATASAVPVVVRVTRAKVAIPGAPAEIERDVATLAGARITYELLPNGAGSGYAIDLGRRGDARLGDLLRSFADSIAVATIPFPDQPVGAGAYWMVASREGAFGLDLVTYRLVTVEQISPEGVTLRVDTKRYSAVPTLDLAGLPPEAPRTLLEFQSTGEGKVELASGAAFAKRSEQSALLAASLGAPGQARGMLELRTRSRISLGE
nr:MAG: hypothetical protein DIU78_21980 [Pseudomonadota bacterium]